jgi:hypothetical protein
MVCIVQVDVAAVHVCCEGHVDVASHFVLLPSFTSLHPPSFPLLLFSLPPSPLNDKWYDSAVGIAIGCSLDRWRSVRFPVGTRFLCFRLHVDCGHWELLCSQQREHSTGSRSFWQVHDTFEGICREVLYCLWIWLEVLSKTTENLRLADVQPRSEPNTSAAFRICVSIFVWRK